MYNTNILHDAGNLLIRPTSPEFFDEKIFLKKIAELPMYKEHLFNFLNNRIYDFKLSIKVYEAYGKDFVENELIAKADLDSFLSIKHRRVKDLKKLKNILEDENVNTGIPSDKNYIHRASKVIENNFKLSPKNSPINYDHHLFSFSKDRKNLKDKDIICQLIDNGLILINSYTIGKFSPSDDKTLDLETQAYTILSDLYTLEKYRHGLCHIKELDMNIYLDSQSISSFIYDCFESLEHHKMFGVITKINNEIVLREIFINKEFEEVFKPTLNDIFMKLIKARSYGTKNALSVYDSDKLIYDFNYHENEINDEETLKRKNEIYSRLLETKKAKELQDRNETKYIRKTMSKEEIIKRL